MKVILLNGSCREKGCTYTALSVVADTLKENGIEQKSSMPFPMTPSSTLSLKNEDRRRPGHRLAGLLGFAVW